MKTSPFVRVQVQILDDIKQEAMVFENQPFIPRIGETVSVYDVDTDGEEIVSGRVIDVQWGYSNEEDGVVSCTVVVCAENS
jgi:hypothetical protein